MNGVRTVVPDLTVDVAFTEQAAPESYGNIVGGWEVLREEVAGGLFGSVACRRSLGEIVGVDCERLSCWKRSSRTETDTCRP